MTRTTNARLAGSTFLIYIAAGIGGLILFDQAAGSWLSPVGSAKAWSTP